MERSYEDNEKNYNCTYLGCFEVPSWDYEGCIHDIFSFCWQHIRFSIGCTSKGRRYLSTLILLAFAIFVPSVALADGAYQPSLAGIIQGPTHWYNKGDSIDGGYDGYFLYAANNFDAALYVLGHSPSDLTDDMKAKLSNSTTGGAFYSFVQTVHPFTNSSKPSAWCNSDFYSQWIVMYGNDYLFWVEVSSSDYSSAKNALETVIDGGSLGGGGGGSSDSEYYTFRLSTVYKGSNQYYYTRFTVGGVTFTNCLQDVSQLGYTLLPDTLYVRIPKDKISIKNDIEPNYGYLVVNMNNVKQTNVLNLGALVFSEVALQTTDTTRTESYDTTSKTFTYDNRLTVDVSATADRVYTISTVGQISNFDFDGTTFTYTPTSVLNLNVSPSTGYTGNPLALLDDSVGSGGSGGAPPSNWPTDPTPAPPTSPTVPDPPTSTPVDPPSDPVGGNPPSFPTQIITTGTTYPVADLQAVLDAMAEHCEHIRDEIYADTSGLYDNLTTFLANQFQVLRNFIGDENNWLFESLENEFQRMMDYLKDLAEWLADQMKFDISGGDYDDSTVVSWLKRIYLKLGTGGVSTKPVDPVADPVGAWDWLAALINNILSALAGGAAALTGTLGELFNGIRTKFPFSIPWDVVAIVTLFDAAPVTPAFTIAYTVFGANVRYDIDLHFFDQQAAMIRAVENVLFCAYLLFKTDWLLNVFGGLSNFLGVKAAGVLKG